MTGDAPQERSPLSLRPSTWLWIILGGFVLLCLLQEGIELLVGTAILLGIPALVVVSIVQHRKRQSDPAPGSVTPPPRPEPERDVPRYVVEPASPVVEEHMRQLVPVDEADDAWIAGEVAAALDPIIVRLSGYSTPRGFVPTMEQSSVWQRFGGYTVEHRELVRGQLSARLRLTPKDRTAPTVDIEFAVDTTSRSRPRRIRVTGVR